jgi:hypothetical protein
VDANGAGVDAGGGMDKGALMVGVRLKEVATRDTVFVDCSVLHSDAIGLAFEVHRTVSEGGTVESVVSQVLVPWSNIRYVVVMEERT